VPCGTARLYSMLRVLDKRHTNKVADFFGQDILHLFHLELIYANPCCDNFELSFA
jgi:hypothetical protein